MSPYYKIAKVSKQAYHQHLDRQKKAEDKTWYYLGLMDQARQMHPSIGLAKIYHLYKPGGIGREAFENLGRLMGYSLECKPRTTWKGRRIIPYQNLLADKQFNDVNQVWVTDITYYKVKETFYYISMIMDLYARKIIGHTVSDTLHAHHSLNLLKKVIKSQGLEPSPELIHHSDKGIQYTCDKYTSCLRQSNIAISMCNSVFENTSMERLNGIIKNGYVIHWNPKSFNQLKRFTARAVKNYNNCPHGKLGMITPNQFELNLRSIPKQKRKLLKVFTFKKLKNNTNQDQLELFNSDLFFNQKGQPFSV